MKKYFAFFMVAWFIFVSHAIYTKHAVYGDGNGYYSYTQSLYFDGSLDFSKIYEHLTQFRGRNYEFSRIFWNYKYDNPYSIGTGLVWFPSMLVMNIFSGNRFDLVYELGPGLTGILCMLVGLFFIEKYLKRYFSDKVIFWTLLTLFFGSNILYYTAFEPALSHQPAFMIVAILIYLLDKNKHNFFILGLLSGLLVSIRVGDIVLLIPVLLILRKSVGDVASFTLGALLGYTPQIVNQLIQYHSIFINPYINGENGQFVINAGRIMATIFSPKRGLIFWTPAYVLAIYGLIKSKKYIFIATVATYWFISSVWTGGLSAWFGIRLLFSSVPYLSYGLAHVFKQTDNISRIKWFSFFSLYNFLLLYGFYFLRWKELP